MDNPVTLRAHVDTEVRLSPGDDMEESNFRDLGDMNVAMTGDFDVVVGQERRGIFDLIERATLSIRTCPEVRRRGLRVVVEFAPAKEVVPNA